MQALVELIAFQLAKDTVLVIRLAHRVVVQVMAVTFSVRTVVMRFVIIVVIVVV